MKKTLLALGLAVYMISISVGAVEEQRVASNVTAFQFNKISSQYMPRPTFASISGFDYGSSSILYFEMDGYGKSGAKYGVATEFVDENIEAIQKYLKWATMARERGDRLDKEIAVISGYEVSPFNHYNSYKFHSGSGDTHYLVISGKLKSLWGGYDSDPSDGSIIFDEENANRLIKMLLEFKEGKVSTTKEDDYQ